MYYVENWHTKVHGDPNNPAILFLHGFMGDMEDWAAVIQELVEYYYCITIDLPGHGKTRVTNLEKNYGMPEIAKGLISLLDNLHIKMCAIVGYSMGGRLALYMVLHYPERFSQGVLESASPGLRKKADHLLRIIHDDQIASELITIPFDRFLVKWYSQPIFESLSKHPDFQSLLKKRKKNVPKELAWSLQNMGTGKQQSLWTRLKHNRVPLLLLAGGLDSKFKSIAYLMEKKCPQSTTKIIAECGHNIHFEKTSAFIESLKVFFKEKRSYRNEYN